MNNTTALFLIGLVTAGTALAAPDLSKLPPPATKQGVTFDQDILPLFKDSCVKCHNGQKAKAGLPLDSLEGVLKGSKDGPVVTPGDSANSQLVLAVSQLDPKTAMPPKPRQRRLPGGAANTNNPALPPGEPNGMTNQPPAGGPPPGMQGPPPKPLTAEQVGLVRAWIDQGAK